MVQAQDGRSFPGPSPFSVVAIAASAGGQEALTTVLSGLPADFPAAILVIQHLLEGHTSYLASILDRSGPLPARPAREGDPVLPGTVVVAPPGMHLTIENWTVHLERSPLVNYVRPSADVLFQSVADVAGSRAIGVVLSGTGHDGAAGAQAIKSAGGTVIVQDAATARYFGMPSATIASTDVDRVLGITAIAEALVDLVVGSPSVPRAHPTA